MNCLKCGSETVSEQVFCPECLLEMEKYPVRPGTVVQLPSQKSHSVAKKAPKRKTVSPEEQVKILRKRLKTVTILFLISAGLAIALAFPAVEHLMEDHFKIGQNYNTVTTPTETS